MSVTDAKAVARKRALAARKEACAAARQDGSEARAQEHLREALAEFEGRVLAGYLPMRAEIDPVPVMTGWSGTVVVPVIDAGGLPLSFARWTPDAAMVPGPFGTERPAELDFVEPEVLIVPMLAVDQWGHRLGYGGAFYDRTLAKLRRAGEVTAIGFAFEAQMTDTLPREETDERLDMLVTEEGPLRFA